VTSTVENISLEFNIFRLAGINTGFFHNIKVSVGARRVAEIRIIVPFISIGIWAAWQARTIGVLELPFIRASCGIGAVGSVIIILTITIDNVIIKSNIFGFAGVHTNIS